MHEAQARDALAPRPPGGSWRGIALSLLAHALLFAALLWGVRWSTPAADIVSAELWSSVPRAAPPSAAPPPPVQAPAPEPPPPAPAKPAPTPPPAPKVDIAVEQARKAADKQRAEQQARLEKERLEKERRDKDKREKDERERKDKEARAKAEADKRAAAQAEERLAKQREENLARMMGQLGTPGAPSGGRPATGATGGPSTSYAGRIVAAIKPNIVFGDTPAGNPAAEVEVRAGPSGSIIGRTLVKSSGNAEWDEAVLRAIDRTGTLPRDVDGRVPARLTITFRPRD